MRLEEEEESEEEVLMTSVMPKMQSSHRHRSLFPSKLRAEQTESAESVRPKPVNLLFSTTLLTSAAEEEASKLREDILRCSNCSINPTFELFLSILHSNDYTG